MSTLDELERKRNINQYWRYVWILSRSKGSNKDKLKQLKDLNESYYFLDDKYEGEIWM